jgi:hypothetical protein
MTEAQIKEQIETIKKATEEALRSKEVARMFLEDPRIFPPEKKSLEKKN